MRIRAERMQFASDAIKLSFERDSGGIPIFWHSLTRREAEQLRADLKKALGSRSK